MKKLMIMITAGILSISSSYPEKDKIDPNVMREILVSEFIKMELFPKGNFVVIEGKKAQSNIMSVLVETRATGYFLKTYGCESVQPKYTMIRKCVENPPAMDMLPIYTQKLRKAINILIDLGAIRIAKEK
ncbi:hypothetical protein OAK75_13285 [Bacteriovoracales bacterium]|nr:hypothetical protein [Bacteriovoracales bacterium]